jgi:hypothetical protein
MILCDNENKEHVAPRAMHTIDGGKYVHMGSHLTP